MAKVNFDNYADNYNHILENQLKFFDGDNSYFAQYKVKIVRDAVKTEPQNILEYGCGIGRNLGFFKQLFPKANIFGCDISKRSLEVATKINPWAELFLIGDEAKHRERYDLIFVAGVFHHLTHELRGESMARIYSWLKSDGVLFIFEHNPYNLITCRMVDTCPFDSDALLLKAKELVRLIEGVGMNVVNRRYALFFPSRLKSLRIYEKYLGFIPLGGQYYIRASK